MKSEFFLALTFTLRRPLFEPAFAYIHVISSFDEQNYRGARGTPQPSVHHSLPEWQFVVLSVWNSRTVGFNGSLFQK